MDSIETGWEASHARTKVSYLRLRCGILSHYGARSQHQEISSEPRVRREKSLNISSRR